jgi:hypothetical protein
VRASLPWAVAGIALAGLAALIVIRNVGLGATRSESEPPAPSAASPDSAGAAPAPGEAMRAPDISSMSPGERADRLFDRVMRLNDEGKRDSVEFFAPMVLSAYQMLGPLDDDQHYELGRIGLVMGDPALATAEADTILRAHATHLLGLALAADAATQTAGPAAGRPYFQRLLAAEPSELTKGLPEYERHRPEIEAAVVAAKQQRAQAAK